MMLQIKNRWTGTVQFECELTTEAESWSFGLQLGFVIKKAIKAGAVLRNSVLSGADLRGADLSNSVLSGADLRGADLSNSVLSGADLRGADLSNSDLSNSVLSGADLRGADLSNSVLRNSVLSGAVLSGVRADMISEILKLPNELEFLRDALSAGRVDGSTYAGECPCLAGTLAQARGIEGYSGEQIPANGIPFIADPNSPRERFFTAIKKGDTPETNGASKIALQWVEEAISMRDHIRKTMPASGPEHM